MIYFFFNFDITTNINIHIYIILYFFINKKYLFNSIFFKKKKKTLGESDSYYVIKDTKSKILQTSGKEGYLYYCETSESACTAINSLGYYIDEATVYTCQLNQEDVLCASGAKPKTICNDKSIGKLGVDEEDYSRMTICLNYNNEKHTPIAAKLTNNSLNYILKHDSNNDIFNLKNDSKYALISVNQSSITLNTSCNYFFN